MWTDTDTDHPAPARRPAGPPRDTGQWLATFDRGPTEELRVTLASYNGHPYIVLRVWALGSDGYWRPVRGKGCSIRLREVAGLAEVLARVADHLDRHGR